MKIHNITVVHSGQVVRSRGTERPGLSVTVPRLDIGGPEANPTVRHASDLVEVSGP